MKYATLVIDANILIKAFREEPETDKARKLIRTITESSTRILAPELLVTETMDVCLS